MAEINKVEFNNIRLFNRFITREIIDLLLVSEIMNHTSYKNAIYIIQRALLEAFYRPGGIGYQKAFEHFKLYLKY